VQASCIAFGHKKLDGNDIATSMRSMRGGFIFRNRGPSLKVHRGQCLTSMTLVDGLPGPHATARSRLMTKRKVPLPDLQNN
jgi:hypothetical protein